MKDDVEIKTLLQQFYYIVAMKLIKQNCNVRIITTMLCVGEWVGLNTPHHLFIDSGFKNPFNVLSVYKN